MIRAMQRKGSQAIPATALRAAGKTTVRHFNLTNTVHQAFEPTTLSLDAREALIVALDTLCDAPNPEAWLAFIQRNPALTLGPVTR